MENVRNVLVCVCRVPLSYVSTVSKQTEDEYENESRLVSEIKCVGIRKSLRSSK